MSFESGKTWVLNYKMCGSIPSFVPSLFKSLHRSSVWVPVLVQFTYSCCLFNVPFRPFPLISNFLRIPYVDGLHYPFKINLSLFG